VIVNGPQDERPNLEIPRVPQGQSHRVRIITSPPQDRFGGKHVQEHLMAETDPVTAPLQKVRCLKRLQ
ncbi:hypothetical protein, partial [Mesorhizobium sp. M1A.T.Ca.IN.004.03.1.1]|uniref:hypothetical protein n=1 Tax=Mesorhizobium sp. M1A.T.Ca.IN.004.03.1.1 TaxID=2496795 RepID=UPI0019CF57BD